MKYTTVCSIGEAAGTAAGLANREKTGVRSVDVQRLRETLKQNNVFLGD